MAMANTLAYYDVATIAAVKRFMLKAPGANPIKRLWSKFTHPSHKLSHLTILKNCQQHRNGLAY
jgi:hypothetical protein